MIKVVLMSLGLLLSGCIGFRWSWEVEDGAVYETNKKSYIVDGGNFVRSEGLQLSDACGRGAAAGE